MSIMFLYNMLNTPKTKNRLSYTRSQASINSHPAVEQVLGKYTKSHHSSLPKTPQNHTNHKMILNKMLTIGNYNKFLTFASKFIDKQILLCKQQPHRLINTKGINFITDGIFIRKLAEISLQPRNVIKHFIGQVRNNKGILKQYQRSLQKQSQKQQQLIQEQHNKQISNQTQQQRQQRLLGYSKNKTVQQQKDNKIIYSEYIKSNRKSMQIYLKIKQKYKQQRNLLSAQQDKAGGKEKQIQRLKRVSIDQYKKKYSNPAQQITDDLMNKLGQVERQILGMFTGIKYIIISSNQVKQSHNIQYLGEHKNNKIWKIALEYKDGHWCPWKDEDQVIQHAITLQPIQSENININNNNNINQIKIDNFIRFYYRRKPI